MPVTRLFQNKDIPQMKSLWKERFHDSDAFISYFFQNRVLSEFSVITEENGELMNMMHAYPISYQIRNHTLPAALLSGFATASAYEGQGYLRRSFLFLLKHLREKGFCCAPLTPVALPYYYAFGFYGASRSVYITADAIPALDAPAIPVAPVDLPAGSPALYPCYQEAARRYGGIVYRSAADFHLKMADYHADGGVCLALFEQDTILAYAIFYVRDQALYGEEIMSRSPQAETLLLDALLSQYPQYRLRLKLSCDSLYAPSFAARVLQPQGACGLLNVSQLLSALGNGLPYVVKVTDPCIPENNGVFCFDGSPSHQEPHVILDAGHLLQFFIGYSSLAALSQQGYAVIKDAKAVSHLDALYPTQPCFIVDEY